jgi:hypothetical protein
LKGFGNHKHSVPDKNNKEDSYHIVSPINVLKKMRNVRVTDRIFETIFNPITLINIF